MDIDELKEYISIARKQKVRRLNLSNKELTELPDEIEKLTNVKAIDLSYNNFKTFPKQLTRMHQLRSILLFRNNIKLIPSEIGNLKDLNLLDLSYNELQELPDEIGNLINLQTLDLGYNKLRHLPIDFINLTSLKKLYLENNDFIFPPEKVIKRGLYATMHYLFGEMRKKEASRVMVQVYNLPQSIHTTFKEYLACFNDMISAVNKHEISFDIKFIRHDILEDMDLEKDVESYLNEFLHFIKNNIKEIKRTTHVESDEVFDLQVIELRNHIINLNLSLKEKTKEIEDLQCQLESFGRLLDKKIDKKKK